MSVFLYYSIVLLLFLDPYQCTLYRKISKAMVECWNRCKNWKTFASTPGANYKTAYMCTFGFGRARLKLHRDAVAAEKPRALTPDLVDELVKWMEGGCSITFEKAQEIFLHEQSLCVDNVDNETNSL